MPNYQDAYISDILATVEETPDYAFDKIVDGLTKAGVQIASADKDECVIEGTVDAAKVRGLEEIPGIKYVRTLFTYVADYPPGDPRDLDKVGREAE
ncbi:MAG TPA: hypothetical protein VHS31_10615 [Tepidisphaeraceae bacterium]|jgi:hypothetical protein|nr:hypothetical protein [Tepidisphaeraceae bacterium]